ncbi:MAG: hypothetical protein IMZ62_18500 [Chloroflexi bacterium]|nr:hypothetical protein [Chloroflexota bacterium]
MSTLPSMDPPTGGGYTPVEPFLGTDVKVLNDIATATDLAYIGAKINVDTNNQIVRLLNQLAPYLKLIPGLSGL